MKCKIDPKLRALELIPSISAVDSHFRIHKNMEIPERSVIYRAFEDVDGSGEILTAQENLNWWRYSRGRLKNENAIVDARKSGEKVFALIAKNPL